ncbi:hypothetical protein [Prevotella sp.]|uniref:hypothetical protein n=1 Tax=Prevotella sp. TaxID=59823 RepID=UPI002647C445|nr:hypothetical protein [Prevotella sp.]MDN5554351.1 hypothetical protein [Prevotella sp.]
MRKLSLSAFSAASALADQFPFPNLSFVCVNLRNLRENMPFAARYYREKIS